MLMYHNIRMEIPQYVPAYPAAYENTYWSLPQPYWFHSHYPVMTEVIEDTHNLPPSSPQSEDSTSSSNISDYHIAEPSENYYASFKIQTSAVPDHGFKVDNMKNEEMPFRCRWKHCDCTFSTLYSLSDHVASTHSDVNGGLFYCGWEGCSRGDRGFNARYKMLVHVRTHTNEKPHKCKQCDKSFSRAENLKIHTRTHSGEKPYICPVEGCNKAYSNSSDRFKHTRTHSVDKPYCCKIPGCPKRYTDPSSLRKHVKTYKHVIVSSSPSKDDTYMEENIDTSNNSCENITSSNFDSGDDYANKKDNSEGEMKYSNSKYLYPENSYNTQNSFDNTTNYTATKIMPNHSMNSQKLYCINEESHQDQYQENVNINNYDQEMDLESRHPIKNELNYQYLEEPLNLKQYRSDIVYDNGIINLEKKMKTEEYYHEHRLTDIPLDLSLRKSLL